MKNLKIAELLAIGLITTISAPLSFAQEVKGGGQGIEQDGRTVLMDTVEGLAQTGRCQWVPMVEVLPLYPTAVEAIQKLESIHAYAAQAFRSEAERMHVCFGGKLEPIKEKKKEGKKVFVRFNKKLKTLAYRWNQKVLIDEIGMASLSPVDQGMLLVHEIGHSFIPMNPIFSGGAIQANDYPMPAIFDATQDAEVFSRPNRLWSFINSIYRNWRDGITAKQFSLAITQNGATLPETDAFWQKSPAEYKLAFDRSATKKERIIALSKIDFREATSNLVISDLKQLEYFLNTWYSTAINIMANRNYSWEQALREQIETYGLDPLQVLPNGTSLLTIAIDNQDQQAVNVLLSYPAQSKDRAIRTRFFNAILKGKIILDNPAVILNQFDPNEGELIRKNVNGIQTYIGELPFFVIAIQKGNFEVATAFLNTGRVNKNVLAQGFEVLMSFNMGYTLYEASPEQDVRRELMNSILSTTDFKPRHEDLLAALKVQNEYAAFKLLDTVKPTANELSQLAQNPWSLGYGIEVLKKAIAKPGVDLNVKDRNGRTMIDYAITNRSIDLFDLLIAAGANKFKKSHFEQEKEWIMGRLIERNASKALAAYMTQTQFNNELALLKQLDLAQIRLKADAARVIQEHLSSVQQ